MLRAGIASVIRLQSIHLHVLSLGLISLANNGRNRTAYPNQSTVSPLKLYGMRGKGVQAAEWRDMFQLYLLGVGVSILDRYVAIEGFRQENKVVLNVLRRN